MPTSTRGRIGSLGARLAAAGLTLTATVTLMTDTATAGPVGQEVVVGDVTFTQNGSSWIITASDGSIIDYVSFDILANESVQFIQPGEFARVLNRIDSAMPTQILGTLSANGIVYFVNPAGVVFGDGATVNAAGLVAAAGHLSNEDFLAGEDRFTGLAGTVENRGTITTAGGMTALVGSQVLNAGSIAADGGMIAMVAGDSVWLRTIDGKLAVRVDGKDITGQAVPWAGTLTGAGTAVENTGTIQSAGGQVVLGAGDVAGLAVRNAGSIIAPGGEVTLAATQGVVRNEGLIDVSGPTGGDVTLQGPAVENLGSIHADGSEVRAGTVTLNGRQYTVLFPGSLVSARGTANGADGGKVVVNSNEGASLLAGGATIDARGADGAVGGAGGAIEFGGMGMALQGTIRLDAGSGGVPGTFMFLGSVVDVGLGGDNTEFDSLIADGQVTLEELNELVGVDEVFISANTLFNATGQILIQASGDIFLVSNVQFDPDANVDLVLEANQDVDFRQFTILGANSIDATAGLDQSGNGTIEINMALSAEESIRLTGDLIRLDGANLTASDTITLDGQTSLLADATLTASSVAVGGGDGNGGNSLTIDANSASIGGDWSGLGTLDVTGDATLAADADLAGDQLDFGGGLQLLGDASLNGTSLVRLGGDVAVTDEGYVLVLGSDGTIELLGSITDSPFSDQLGTLEVNGDAVVGTAGGATVRTSGAQSWNGSITLDSNLTLTGGTIDVLGGSSASGRNLSITASDISIGDGWSGLGLFSAGGESSIGAGVTIDGQQVIFGGDIALLGDATLLGAQLLRINGDITVADNGFALELGSDEAIELNGRISNGSFDPKLLGSLLVNGDVSIDRPDGAVIRTSGDQTWNGAISLLSDLSLSGTSITLQGGTGNDGRTLAVDADAISVGGDWTGLNTLDLDGPTTLAGGISIAGEQVVFGETLALEGDADLFGAQLLRLGGDVTVADDGFDLVLGTDGQIEIDGSIRNSSFDPPRLGTLTVNGDAFVRSPDGTIIRTSGHQAWNGNVLLGGDLTVAAGTAEFNGTINASVAVPEGGDPEIRGGLVAEVAEGVTFNGAIGDQEDGFLRVVDVEGASVLAGGLIRTRDGQVYNGPVTVVGLNELSSLQSGDVVFADTVVGGGVAGGEGEGVPVLLVQTQGDTRFEGDVSGLADLETDAGGRTVLAADVTADRIRFGDAVALESDATVTGAQLVRFGDTVDGGFALTVASDELVEFLGSIGAGEGGALAALTVTVDAAGAITDRNLVVFGPDASTVVVDGDLSLNDGRSVDGSQLVASVAALGDLTLRSLEGDVRLGEREKLTVLGSLSLDAAAGTVAFGDLTVVNDLTVDGQAIEIFAREAGQYLAADGTLQDDSGTDIVVGGSVSLGATPTVVALSADAANPVFAVASPQEIANLGELEVVETDAFTAADLQVPTAGAGEGEPQGVTVLDAGVLVQPDGGDGGDGGNGGDGGTGGPDEPEQFEGTLAEFTGEEIRRRRGEIQDVRVNRDPIAQETLQRLALIIRSLRPEELRTLPEGRLLTVDVADPAVLRGETPPTSAARVRTDALAAAGERIERLLGPVDDTMAADAAAVEIRESLLRSWAVWRAEDGEAGTPDEFAAWLETAGDEQAAARFAVESLRDVAASIGAMGLTRTERDAAIRPLIRAVAPATLGEAFVFELVMGG